MYVSVPQKSQKDSGFLEELHNTATLADLGMLINTSKIIHHLLSKYSVIKQGRGGGNYFEFCPIGEAFII